MYSIYHLRIHILKHYFSYLTLKNKCSKIAELSIKTLGRKADLEMDFCLKFGGNYSGVPKHQLKGCWKWTVFQRECLVWDASGLGVGEFPIRYSPAQSSDVVSSRPSADLVWFHLPRADVFSGCGDVGMEKIPTCWRKLRGLEVAVETAVPLADSDPIPSLLGSESWDLNKKA